MHRPHPQLQCQATGQSDGYVAGDTDQAQGKMAEFAAKFESQDSHINRLAPQVTVFGSRKTVPSRISIMPFEYLSDLQQPSDGRVQPHTSRP